MEEKLHPGTKTSFTRDRRQRLSRLGGLLPSGRETFGQLNPTFSLRLGVMVKILDPSAGRFQERAPPSGFLPAKSWTGDSSAIAPPIENLSMFTHPGTCFQNKLSVTPA